MDLDTVADELYALPPDEFTAVRDERALAARAAGDRELSDRIRQLRRPTLAAWAGNLLARDPGRDRTRLLRLGEELRQAHQELDGRRLRELSGQQHEVVAALTGQARRLTARAGHPLGPNAERELEGTLRAVLADRQAAQDWAGGRLAQPLTAIGFGILPDVPQAARAPAPAPHAGTGKVVDLDAARTRRRARETHLAPETDGERERDREQARQQAADAERDARAAAAETAAARTAERQALDRHQAAQQQVTTLSGQLAEAEDELRRARRAAETAGERVRQAEHAEREIRRRAAEAAAPAPRQTGPEHRDR
ncbi:MULTISPECIES: hypothetical protein [unclassified Streptomyces]|uniref:hypothetical protein n=1 Tax=unclassified Streptomyces TaxID=2593676 RepID=UPI00035C5174|nr:MULTISPECIES: hypothetical protein [unclassified Streptomyces]MYT28652.1 hypothetical protein [Streptomyces sp. SID8354]